MHHFCFICFFTTIVIFLFCPIKLALSQLTSFTFVLSFFPHPTVGVVSKQLCCSACQVKPQHGFHLKTISYTDSLAAECHLGINHSLSRNLISDFFHLNIFLLPVNITNFRTRIIAALVDRLITISEL